MPSSGRVPWERVLRCLLLIKALSIPVRQTPRLRRRNRLFWVLRVYHSNLTADARLRGAGVKRGRAKSDCNPTRQSALG